MSRDRRVAEAQEELAAALADWPAKERAAYSSATIRPIGCASTCPHKVAHAELHPRCRRAAGRTLATEVTTHAFEAITEITVLAPDHPRLLSVIAGACTAAGGNIVDAQIFTTTDGRALDTISISREFDRRGRRAAPRARRSAT